MGPVLRGNIVARLAGPVLDRIVGSSLVPRQNPLPLPTVPIRPIRCHRGSCREVTSGSAEGAGSVQTYHVLGEQHFVVP